MEQSEKDTASYSTETQATELDAIYENSLHSFDDVVFDENDTWQNLKVFANLFRRKIFMKFKEKRKKDFKQILYVTMEKAPLDYVYKLREQHPEKEIIVLLPIIDKPNGLEKTSVSFDFYCQNRMVSATLYRYPKNKENVDVLGVYSPAFSNVKNLNELSRLHNLVPFIKSVRICAKKIKPEIIHVENIPFFLGAELEKYKANNYKVFQVIKDFSLIEMNRIEAFWAAINLADKSFMKKICRDMIIKKLIAQLFHLHNTKKFYQMRDCLKFIYKNYFKFRKYVDKGADIEENIIFNQLNKRILQMFPQLVYGEEYYYNPMFYTIKRADFWATYSKTYYKEIFDKPEICGKMFKQILKTKEKSSYVYYGFNKDEYPLENTNQIYHSFNSSNFREQREKNKVALIKEFNSDRIKTNFVDIALFKNEDYKIVGNLDSFYQAPLMFANLNNDIFANGIDILFATILKLFELHKNIQVIISIKDGLKNNYIKTWVDFLSKNKYFNGRWVFIDGDINLPKFLAGSDMFLLPRRVNTNSNEHFLAMHYGCVPIVSRVGILNDTVKDIFDDITNGCGLKTKVNLITENDAYEAFLTPVMKALNIIQNNPASWNMLIKNSMNYQFDWSFEVLEKYNQIYDELM